MKTIITLLIVFAASSLSAFDSVELSDNFNSLPVGKFLETLEDTNNNLTWVIYYSS